MNDPLREARLPGKIVIGVQRRMVARPFRKRLNHALCEIDGQGLSITLTQRDHDTVPFKPSRLKSRHIGVTAQTLLKAFIRTPAEEPKVDSDRTMVS